MLEDTERTLPNIKAVGAAAAIVRDAAKVDVEIPILRVPDTHDALRMIAEANRDRTKAQRVLVTGSEGKTGFKAMLRHVLSRSIRAREP